MIAAAIATVRRHALNDQDAADLLEALGLEPFDPRITDVHLSIPSFHGGASKAAAPANNSGTK